MAQPILGSCSSGKITLKLNLNSRPDMGNQSYMIFHSGGEIESKHKKNIANKIGGLSESGLWSSDRK